MKLPTLPGGWVTWAGLGAAVVAIGYAMTRKAAGDPRGVAEIIGQGVGQAAASAAGGVATGAVVGAGAVVGIPATNATRCEAAKAAGNTWDASLYCPATDFLKWSANRVAGSGKTQSGPAASNTRTVGAAAVRPTLRQGDRGPLVTEVQRRLGITADGVFGEITSRAVKIFQTRNGLAADGIIGPATWRKLETGDRFTFAWGL